LDVFESLLYAIVHPKIIDFILSELHVIPFTIPIKNTLVILLIVSICYMICSLWKDSVLRRLVLWFAISLLSVMGFLVTLSVLTGLDFACQPRHLYTIVPLFLLLFFIKICRGTDKISVLIKKIVSNKVVYVCILCVCYAGIIIYASHKNTQFELFGLQKKNVSSVIEQIASTDISAPIIVIGTENFWKIYMMEDKVQAYSLYNDISEVLNRRTYFLRPTWVFIVSNSAQKSSENTFELFKTEHNLINVYCHKFDKGYFYDQIKIHSH
jgi:hypothetical protein